MSHPPWKLPGRTPPSPKPQVSSWRKPPNGPGPSGSAPVTSANGVVNSSGRHRNPARPGGAAAPIVTSPPGPGPGKQTTHSAKSKKGLFIPDENNSGLIPLYQATPSPEWDQEEDGTSSPTLSTSIAALPENVLENLFTFLDLGDVVACSFVCQEWQRVMGDQNGDVWRALCYKKMDKETLNSDFLVTCPTYKSKLRAFFHAWNPSDCSRNVYVKPNGFTIHRNPVAQSTDGVRGKIGFSSGRHAWEVKWEGPLGTVAVVGVATREAELRSPGYIALLGKDEHSWGWNLVENVLLHNGESQGNYPLVNNAPRYQVGERIRVILDCEDNTLSFEKNDEFLGVAFRGLPQHEALYPAVSAVYGNSEISMIYLGPPLDG